MSWSIGGKQVLITGANSGIGLATAAELARRGANVAITARSDAKGLQAAEHIKRASGTDVCVRHLDLSRLDSIRSFSAEFAGDHERLDVLINNAGVMTGKRRQTPDGYEWTFAVNHLGPFLLTQLLTPLLTASAPSRIINVSSATHRSVKRGLDFDDLQMQRNYSSSRAYAASKLANILFTVELDRRLGDAGVTARALHPGVVGTSFGKGPEGPRWMRALMTVGAPLLLSPERGAATSVMLATAEDAAIDGGLYWSNEKPSQPLPGALDVEQAIRLWDESERLVAPPS
jgi:NAD(P)-dependent dehydrogenase (short-subunit alcohol dehydrogenase family)